MTIGYWLLVIALFSFAGMGIVHKLGDRLGADALHIALFTMATSSALSFIYALVFQRTALTSWNNTVLAIALPFGACAACALWLFQRGLRYGRIATSWLLINLSSAIPTVLSVIVYREPLSLKKLVVLALIIVSLVLLWWDRKQDRGKGEQRSLAMAPSPAGEAD